MSIFSSSRKIHSPQEWRRAMGAKRHSYSRSSPNFNSYKPKKKIRGWKIFKKIFKLGAVVLILTWLGGTIMIAWASRDLPNPDKLIDRSVAQSTKIFDRTGTNLLYEIYNEPLDVSWSTVIKPYSEDVIDAIRDIDPDNLIIVGTGNWSQRVKEPADDPIEGYANIAYGLHFYAGTHKQWLRDYATYALNKGIALVVSEWGTVNSDGKGDVDDTSVDEWVTFMKDNNLINCVWALNDKSESASMLYSGTSTTGYWDESDFTESGKLVVDLIKNWEGNHVDIVSPDPELNIRISYKNKSTLQVLCSSEIINVNMYDTYGKVLLSQQNINSLSTEIAVPELNQHLAIIKITTKQGVFSTKLCLQ